MHRFLSGPAAVLLAALLPAAVWAQDVVRHPDPSEPLAERWEWALTEVDEGCANECWIAYSIERMMEANSYTGSYSNRGAGHPTLQFQVYGREVEPTPDATDRSDNRRYTGASQRVMKEVVLLMRFDRSSRSIRDLRMSNISLPAPLDDLPLIWLGVADQPESSELLQEQYGETAEVELKEDLVSAIGMHDAAEGLPFLREVLASSVDDEVREQAVFWIAEANDPDVLPLLERTARGDASEDVREQAVFGISRIETEAADDLLIRLARDLDDRETREEAVFWLGQKASARAAESLEDIAENDPDVEIQKRAIFALSELPADEGVPRLISIARNHRSSEVRGEAIFWLGESGDPRAVDVLVEIVRGQ